MNDSSSIRLPQIDFLRAAAVFLVIGNHMEVCPPTISSFLYQATEIWHRGGWAGVDLFFVLSGFLISGLLFSEYKKHDRINIKKFLVRRGFKIYPAFWFFICVSLIIINLSGENLYRRGIFDELFFVQNYQPAIWEHTWSLAVEEHFYIFLSLLFFVLLITNRKDAGKNSFAFIPKLFFFIAAFCLLLRCVTAVYLPFQYNWNIEPTHLRIDSLFYGVFLAYLWHFRGLSESRFLEKHKFFIGLAGACCFLPVFIFVLRETPLLSTIGLTLLYIGSGFVLLALLRSDAAKNSFVRSFAGLGKYSYSIYIWNLPVHFWLTKFTDLAAENWFLYAFLYWAGTLVLGIGTAKLVEYPVLRLRDKIMPSQISALKTA